jgi:hypothetical protein
MIQRFKDSKIQRFKEFKDCNDLWLVSLQSLNSLKNSRLRSRAACPEPSGIALRGLIISFSTYYHAKGFPEGSGQAVRERCINYDLLLIENQI